MQKTKVLTFESWVTKREWFQYAIDHPATIPYLLCDRSPCQDPFFDLFAPAPRDREPMITGLCRSLKNFCEGDRYVLRHPFVPGCRKSQGLNQWNVVLGCRLDARNASRAFA